MSKKGLLVFVYRNGSDCTNGGVTSRIDQIVLIGDAIPKVTEADDIYLELRYRGDHVYAVPVGEGSFSGTGYMMGGNFIYTSDSRFPSPQPIPVHDRRESWGTYRRLSN